MRRNLVRSQLVCFLLAVISTVAQTGQQLPIIAGESLAGHKVVLPEAARGSITVLILGFTKASKTPTSAWAKRLSQDLGSDPRFRLYQLPVLEDVPRLFRGMVISGIKKGVPENMWDRFVPILNGEADLKKAVDYRDQDAAYLVLLDRDSRVVRQAHGQLTDEAYALLATEIRSLLEQK